MTLEKIKNKHKLSNKAIAKALNVTERTVYNWLSGSTEMPEAYLFYLNSKVKK
jgi:DNA-binding transcriptional regulator YiaG